MAATELNRVGGLHACSCSELRSRAQVVVRQVDESNATATREQCLLPFRQRTVAGAIRNNEDFQQENLDDGVTPIVTSRRDEGFWFAALTTAALGSTYLVSQTFASWSVVSWLRQVESIRATA